MKAHTHYPLERNGRSRVPRWIITIRSVAAIDFPARPSSLDEAEILLAFHRTPRDNAWDHISRPPTRRRWGGCFDVANLSHLVHPGTDCRTRASRSALALPARRSFPGR